MPCHPVFAPSDTLPLACPHLCCPAIKDRIVEALDQLYINGWAGNVFSSAQAARNLIDLATGATLGALLGLEGHGCRRTTCGRAPGIHLEPVGQVLWHRMCVCTCKLVLCHVPCTIIAADQGCTCIAASTAAGELGSLEEVVKEFIHKQFLRPVMLHEVRSHLLSMCTAHLCGDAHTASHTCIVDGWLLRCS